MVWYEEKCTLCGFTFKAWGDYKTRKERKAHMTTAHPKEREEVVIQHANYELKLDELKKKYPKRDYGYYFCFVGQPAED